MKRRQKKRILKALNVIKHECKYSTCSTCPLGITVPLPTVGTYEPRDGTRKDEYSQDACLLRRSMPSLWNIKNEESIWKALV